MNSKGHGHSEEETVGIQNRKEGNASECYIQGQNVLNLDLRGDACSSVSFCFCGRGPSTIWSLHFRLQARRLLKEAADGVNPFEGFTPKLADGESLVFGTEEFEAMEAKGLEAASKTAFVLVRNTRVKSASCG